MKTKIILFLLCLLTLNVMGQTTIRREKKKEPVKKETRTSKPTSSKPAARQTTRQSQPQPVSKPKLTLDNLMSNMVYVEGGTFTMGATSEQQNPFSDEKPTHRVTLSGYYIGKYEVTQALWKAVMGSNPSNWKSDNRPVERVSWDDCQTFLRKLNSMTGRTFRLPTEAEWE